MARILLVDDEVSIRKALERFLTGLRHEVVCAADGEEALRRAEENPIDVALVDLVMPKMGGIELIRSLKQRRPELVSIVLTGFGTITSAVEAMKAGAYHYVTKPFELDDIAQLIDTALEHHSLKEENRRLKDQLHGRYRFENIIGTNDGLGSVFDMIEKVSETDSTVLILGESGTGKELIARAIHYNSPRREKPLVTVNCAAIPEELLESELFGHVKGAFTGAVGTRPGRFDVADHGTIFLDEIGDMSLKLQVKVLRVLQEQRFEPVGSNKTHQVDVRIIAATNQNLEQLVAERRFREDLFYRLNVIPIHLPPLRERPADIALLVRHFVEKYNAVCGHRLEGVNEETLKLLQGYDWPGNVRELENVMERSVVLKKMGILRREDLPEKLLNHAPRTGESLPVKEGIAEMRIPDAGISFKHAVADFETELIMQALERTGGNKNRAASLLKLNRTTLVEKIKKRQLEKRVPT